MPDTMPTILRAVCFSGVSSAYLAQLPAFRYVTIAAGHTQRGGEESHGGHEFIHRNSSQHFDIF